MAALTVWLRVLRVPSAAFCWAVWAILGQASGAYVGPACWAVLFLAGAAAVLHQRPTATAHAQVHIVTLPRAPTLGRLSAFAPSTGA